MSTQTAHNVAHDVPICNITNGVGQFRPASYGRQEIADALGVSVFTAHKAASDIPILEIKNENGQFRPASYGRQENGAGVLP